MRASLMKTKERIKMKNKLKIVAMALCFLSISSQAFATKSNINEYGTDVKEETIVSSDTPQYQDTQEQNKRLYLLILRRKMIFMSREVELL